MPKTSDIFEQMDDKAERDAYVRSLIGVTIPMQIRALREKRNWNQAKLAEHASMLQPRVSALESPGGNVPNLNTLLRIASAFDVGLLVWFVPFSELVQREEAFSPDTFTVASFSVKRPVEPALERQYEAKQSTPVPTTRDTYASNTDDVEREAKDAFSAVGGMPAKVILGTAAPQWYQELIP